ncbi:MAG: FKBP-type peptidyl-prolyl cis-trans isomerase [Lachnospiraceae bacterium]|nr:FKBP-type peptidyl-prolyl cis-trans isomerase [Lachnospiraceae bacterium]
MKIAVTYENGSVFQHFGKTREFKLYEVENNAIVSTEITGNNGAGHEALAELLADLGVEVLICGGLGQGARDALTDAGIQVFSGAAGDADEAVACYLSGALESSGVNCDHHDHEEEADDDEIPEEEGCGGCGSCGGGCGGCSGCGEPEIILEGKNAGKLVSVHYRGTLNDGTQFDSSYDRGETLDFLCGAGMMIAGFDKAVVDMEVGQEVDIHLSPEEAYGPVNPAAIFTVPLAALAGAEKLEVGAQIHLSTGGRPFPCKVTDKTEESITFDANHELAGQELNFHILLVEVQE